MFYRHLPLMTAVKNPKAGQILARQKMKAPFEITNGPANREK
jgi:hypothetical protein